MKLKIVLVYEITYPITSKTCYIYSVHILVTLKCLSGLYLNINDFSFQTYFGMDVSAVEDPVQRRALETMIKTYGQTPRQLFHSAHVCRQGSKLLMEGELPAAVGLLVQLAFRENRESSREPSYPVSKNTFYLYT